MSSVVRCRRLGARLPPSLTVSGPGQKAYDISTAGIDFADTHHLLS